MMENQPFVIAGAGLAGATAARTLREEGYGGPLVLLGAEKHEPYIRPPLSKAYLAGTATLDSLHLKARATLDKAGVELLQGRRVQALDRTGRRVAFEDGSSIGYARLALATGGRPRPLPPAIVGMAEDADNFHYLRTLADVDRIRRHFAPGARLAIVGGGYIGLEVAAVAVKAGLQVTVLEAADRVLARVTAPRVSSFYEQVHREAGVDLRIGVQVDGFELDAAHRTVTGVHCADGERLACELVIVGIGIVPNTELAAAAGLAVDDGIRIDACARTSDPHIVAAGDCTRFDSALYGRAVRLESVPNALEQARSAAAALLGHERPFESAPWFWSDQYELKLKMVGLSQGHDRFLLRGSVEQRSFSAFYLKGERVIAVDTVNRPAEFMLAKRIVGERMVIPPERLVDDSAPLKSLLQEALPL